MAALTPEGGAPAPAGEQPPVKVETAKPPAQITPPAGPQKPPARLRWRADLRATAQSLEGGRQIVVEDPVGGRFFRLGVNEYAFARALNSQRDLGLALAFANATEKEAPLSGQEAMLVAQFLVRNGLVEEVVEGEAARTKIAPPKPKKRFGALFQRLPLGNPNRLLDRLMPLLGWFTGWWFAPLWLAAAGWALVTLVQNWDRWVADAGGVLDTGNLLWMPVAWFLLKLWHELNHGLVAKRYGADVVECGILMVLFAPLGGYVDATASWRLTDRWKRMHVSAAGIIAETFLGAVAILVWASQPPGPLASLAYNVALLATVSTILFNANPLMRFDGYYVLIDLIERPNLYQRGMAYCRYLGRRLFLGAKAQGDPAQGPAAPRLIKVYGLMTLVWRWMVMISILVMATAWFSGLGILLFLFGVVTWLVIPAVRMVKRELASGAAGRRGILRAGLIVAGLAAFLGVFNLALPLRPSVEAPGLVAYVQATTLRAEAAGYVAEVGIRRGDRVAAGDLLLRLENPEMAQEAAMLRADIAALDLEASQALILGDLETEAAKRAERGVVGSKLADLERQLASLQVIAPHDGVVVASDLAAWLGAYMKRGEELGEVADPASLRFEISIPEHLVPSFRAQLGAEVVVELPGSRLVSGTLVDVAPKGSLAKPPDALTAVGGGPIALRNVTNEKGTEQQAVESQFKGIVALPADALARLDAGELGWVTVRGEPRSLFGLALDAWRRWTGHILAAVQG